MHENVAKPLNNRSFPVMVDWNTPWLRSWHLFYDYAGGNMTDQGTHLMDVVHWVTNAPPKSAIAIDQMAKNTVTEHTEIFSPTQELNTCNDFEGSWQISFMGDQRSDLLMSSRNFSRAVETE